MKEIYKDYLFEKHILVSDEETEEKHVFETLFAMAHFFGVKITKGTIKCRSGKEERQNHIGTIRFDVLLAD